MPPKIIRLSVCFPINDQLFISPHVILLKILSTWIICTLLAAVIAIILLKISKYFGRRIGLSLIRSDAYKRIALVFAGALGAYSLGANNIANVIGVFIPVQPLPDR